METVLPLDTAKKGKVYTSGLVSETKKSDYKSSLPSGKEMQTVLPSDTVDSGKVSTSDLVGDTQKADYNLCSICNFIVPESALQSSGFPDALDDRFISQYMSVLQEFKDTYRDLDASVELFDKAFRDMDKFAYSKDLSVSDNYPIDAIASELRHRTYKSHVKNASRNLTSDLARLRIFLETCFHLQRDILEECRGWPEIPMSQTTENRSRGLLDALAKNTYKMREQLSACKCLIQSFDRLNDSVLNVYYVN